MIQRPIRYFPLRTGQEPPSSNFPTLVLAALALLALIGTFADIAARA